MRCDKRAQAARIFQNLLRIGSAREPNHQPRHERVPCPDRVFHDNLRSRSGHELAALPQRRAFFRQRDANARNIRGFRDRCAGLRDFIGIPRRVRASLRPFAATRQVARPRHR